MFFVAWPRLLQHPRLRWLSRLACTMALLCLVWISLRPYYNGHWGRPKQMNLPVQALASALRQGSSEPMVIVSNNKHLVGTMRLAFPGARLVHSGSPGALPAGPLWLLTYAADFDALRQLQPDWAAAQPTLLELPHNHAAADRPPLRFAFAVVGAPLSAGAASGAAGGTSR
jgi:hypothetical protein